MEICSDRKKVKELVVALEMSENENILKEILKWTQNSVVNVVQVGMSSKCKTDILTVHDCIVYSRDVLTQFSFFSGSQERSK